MPGMSDTPVDGQQYSGLFNGVPVVLEYDGSAGGYKLVVAQEYAVNFMISGVVALEPGDIEIGAVELKDYVTDDRAHVDTSHLLHVCLASGTIWTIAVVQSDKREDTAHITGDWGNFNLSVRQDAHGPSGGDGDYVAFLSDANGYLKVWTTGSHSFVDVLSDPALEKDVDEVTAYVTGSVGLVDADGDLAKINADGCLQVAVCTGSVVADTELPAAAVLTDDFANPTAPAVGSFGMGYYPASGSWSRLTVDENDQLKVSLSSDIQIGAVEIKDADTDQRAEVDSDGCLHVSVCTGTIVADTELPAAVALADGTATPTAPAVGSFPHGWDEVDSAWDRLRNEGASGSYALRTSQWGMAPSGYRPILIDDDGHLQVDILSDPVLAKDTDEVTAYVTGSVRIVDSEGHEAGVSEAGCLQVQVCTGTVIAHVEGDIQIGAVEIKDGDSDQRAEVDADGCLHVSVCTGSVVVGDGGDSLTVDDGGSSLTVDGAVTIPKLDKDTDEVSAYVTGSVRIVDSDGHEVDVSEDGCLKVQVCTGTVVATLETGDIEIGAVEIKDSDTDQRAGVNDDGCLKVAVCTGSVVADTELPAAAALADATASPTAPAVGSFPHGWDEVDSTWDRLRNEGASGSYALRASSWGMAPSGYRPMLLDDDGHLQVDVLSDPVLDKDTDEVTAYVTGTIRIVDSEGHEAGVSEAGCLQVQVCTGTVIAHLEGDVEIGAVEIKDGDTDQRAEVTADGCLQVAVCTGSVVVGDGGGSITVDGTVTADTELPVAAVLSDDFANPTAPAVGAFGMGYYPASGSWSRLTVDENDALKVSLSSDIEIGAVEIKDGDSDQRASVSADGCLQVAVCTGSVVVGDGGDSLTIDGSVTADTELPAAAALADGMANPTAPAVASSLMGYNGLTWDRIYMGLSGSVKVDLSTRLDKTNDEVTAYVTGSVGLVDADGDLANINADGCLHVAVCTGSVVADTELPAAAALADATATPTAPAVGSFPHGWDEVDSTWDRLRNEGASGSYALRSSIWGMAPSGYRPVLIDAEGHLQIDVLSDPALAKTTDEVTAYVTGSVGLVDADGDLAKIDANGCLQVAVCTGSVVVGDGGGTISVDDGGGALTVDGTVTADTELPVAAVLSDDFANPTAPAVGAFGMGYYPASGSWSRLTVDENDALKVSLSSDIQIGAVEIKDGDSDQRASVNADGCLQVAVCTGSVVVGDGGGTISVDDGGGAITVDGSVTVQNLDKDSDEVTAYVTGSVRLVDSDGDEAAITADGCLQVSVCTGTVVADTELPAAAALADATASPTAPAVGSFPHGWDEVDSTWDRLRNEGASGSYALRTSSWGMAPSGYRPVLLDNDGHLQVDVLSDPVLAKDTDEVTAYVTGSVVIEDGGGSITVDGTVAIGDLDKGSDEVTAYVTGSVRLVDSDGDIAGISADGCLQVAICTGTVVADVSLDQSTDSVKAHLPTGSIIGLSGQTKVIERTPINITGTAGEYMLITGTSSERVKVMEFMLIASADTEVIFKSGWTGTALTGPMSLPADGDGFFCGAPATPDLFHFQTNFNEMLVIQLVGGARIGGWINWYDE